MKAQTKTDPLIGTWVSDDEFTSDVEYTVSTTGGDYKVAVVDAYDGEEGEVRDVATDRDGRLCFCNK